MRKVTQVKKAVVRISDPDSAQKREIVRHEALVETNAILREEDGKLLYGTLVKDKTGKWLERVELKVPVVDGLLDTTSFQHIDRTQQRTAGNAEWDKKEEFQVWDPEADMDTELRQAWVVRNDPLKHRERAGVYQGNRRWAKMIEERMQSWLRDHEMDWAHEQERMAMVRESNEYLRSLPRWYLMPIGQTTPVRANKWVAYEGDRVIAF